MTQNTLPEEIREFIETIRSETGLPVPCYCRYGIGAIIGCLSGRNDAVTFGKFVSKSVVPWYVQKGRHFTGSTIGKNILTWLEWFEADQFQQKNKPKTKPINVK